MISTHVLPRPAGRATPKTPSERLSFASRDGQPCPSALVGDAIDLLRNALQLHAKQGRRNEASTLERACMLLEVEQERRSAKAQVRGGLTPFQVNRLCVFIDGHLASRIGLEDMATIAGLSTSRLARAFTQSFGVSPTRYILERRIMRAMDLLETTDRPLVQIALECGFCDQPHFTRRFHKVVGLTPKVWRRRLAMDGSAEPGSQVSLEAA